MNPVVSALLVILVELVALVIVYLAKPGLFKRTPKVQASETPTLQAILERQDILNNNIQLVYEAVCKSDSGSGVPLNDGSDEAENCWIAYLDYMKNTKEIASVQSAESKAPETKAAPSEQPESDKLATNEKSNGRGTKAAKKD